MKLDSTTEQALNLNTVTLTAKQKASIALLETWNAERASASSEELAQNDAEYEAFKASINQRAPKRDARLRFCEPDVNRRYKPRSIIPHL